MSILIVYGIFITDKGIDLYKHSGNLQRESNVLC
jgi:hypothetical protein